MVETTHMSEHKRRRSEGDAAAIADAIASPGEQQSAVAGTRRESSASNGSSSATENGQHERVNGDANGEEAKQERDEDDASSAAVNGHSVHALQEEETKQHEPGGVASSSVQDSTESVDDDEGDSDDEEEEDEVLVVLELADFKNHPIFDDYRTIRIEGIDTAAPVLQIGEYTLYGQLEETVGTNFFYDTTNRTRKNQYQYAGQTTKKIRFTIAPPEP